MTYCLYYQAKIVERECWFLVAIMRSFEHLAFDRTVDKETSTFEFFVPCQVEPTFLELMSYLKKHDVVLELHALPNRLRDPEAVI
jgi:hypothetical protein